jgi:hypothetical protein
MNAGRTGMTAAGILACGFTLAIVAAIAVPIVLYLRETHRREATEQLLKQVGDATNRYLKDHPQLDEKEAVSFCAKPWTYLFVVPNRDKLGSAYLDLPAERTARDGKPVVSNREGEQILDFFGNPVLFSYAENQIEISGSTKPTSTTWIRVRWTTAHER